MQAFDISAKNLAAFNMPDFCHLCGSRLLHLNFKKPWEIFPGIFSSFDARQKRLVHRHLDQNGSLPAWFGAFDDGLEYLKVGRMKHWFQGKNITVTAIPDDIFKMSDGRLAIVDYKTARYTAGQDRLLPMYKAQLSVYAMLAEELGYGEVAKAGLIYFEPVVDDDDAALIKTLTKGGFVQAFKATPVEVKIDFKNVHALLKAARTLYDVAVPPKGIDDCKGCQLVKELHGICRGEDLSRAAAQQHTQDAYIYSVIAKQQRTCLAEAFTEIELTHTSDCACKTPFNLLDVWDWS